MLIPKPSHLVERVAERLLRSGALDDSAAQLLRPPGSKAATDAADEAVSGPAMDDHDRAASGASPPAQPSSLFAPPPSPTAGISQSSPARPVRLPSAPPPAASSATADAGAGTSLSG